MARQFKQDKNLERTFRSRKYDLYGFTTVDGNGLFVQFYDPDGERVGSYEKLARQLSSIVFERRPAYQRVNMHFTYENGHSIHPITEVYAFSRNGNAKHGTARIRSPIGMPLKPLVSLSRSQSA